MKITNFCPLGQKCKSHILDDEGQISETKVCIWLTQLSGTDPMGNEINEEKCAIAYGPIMLHQVAKTNLSTTAAVETFSAEMTNQNTVTRQILGLN
jgi:hypothetical protein